MPSPECPQCGTPLAPGAAQGLCPRCLMAAAALPSEPVVADTPPELEQVAAAFPQLEVLGLIGRGGMGSVFKVRQPKLNRLAALKLLPHSLAEDPAFAGRFEREAQLLARLNHPNIVAVYDYGLTAGFFYLLMEFVDGVNLRQAMRAARFTPAQALGIVPKICEALQFAHEEGILHRDIKPENLLLDAKGRVKLADFGIAKIAAESEAAGGSVPHIDPLLTQAGSALGTPDYMAPEQRERPGEVDHRADIYSLGVVFYEILTGELPRPGAFVPPSGVSAVGPRVDAIVRQALESERERRQASAEEMKTQVENAGTREQVPPPRATGETSGVKLGRQKVKFTSPREHPRTEGTANAGAGASVASSLAVLLGLAGTWKQHLIEEPDSPSKVPVRITQIGAGDPWLREVRWMTEGSVLDARVEVGGIHFNGPPSQLSGLAMVGAGFCWFVWLLLKRRAGKRLDSFLSDSSGSPPLGTIFFGVAVCSFCLWLCFTLAAMAIAVSSAASMRPLGPFSLNAVHWIAIVLGIAWTFRAISIQPHSPEDSRNSLEAPANAWASCLFRLALLVCLLPLLALVTFFGLAQAWKSKSPKLPPGLDTAFGEHSTATPIPATPSTVPGAPATDVRLELIEKTSVTEGEDKRQVRQVAIIAEKPGYLHFWIYGREPLTVPLLPEADGKGYRRNLFYSVNAAERPVLYYSVITDNTQPKTADSLDLANLNISYETIAAEMCQIADPSGKCLRGLPLDLLLVGSAPLLIAVTDDEKMPEPEQLYLHIWHPTYYTEPPQLPAGLLTSGIRIGYPIRSGEILVGRISQRDGRMIADLTYNSATYRGAMVPEQIVEPQFYWVSSILWNMHMVLSKQPEVTPFLLRQVDEDRQKYEEAQRRRNK
ncbi:serine/threonine-protein kinase [Haloferula sp. BvORR071]|uniref:serine/threonine-protein kinase n=1 Tax=Haloferula sp. BvORR071 TaxID=1396141 RepID=UPI000ACAC145|nr:serine/threonine-protein kinase [Haloferula sp. BvORR071]